MAYLIAQLMLSALLVVQCWCHWVETNLTLFDDPKWLIGKLEHKHTPSLGPPSSLPSFLPSSPFEIVCTATFGKKGGGREIHLHLLCGGGGG